MGYHIASVSPHGSPVLERKKEEEKGQEDQKETDKLGTHTHQTQKHTRNMGMTMNRKIQSYLPHI